MLNAMTRECSAGYHAVRAEQVIKADRELWTILAQGNLKSLKPINNVPALNQAFSALLTDPRVTVLATSSFRGQQNYNCARKGVK
jgi:hypothetical protein